MDKIIRSSQFARSWVADNAAILDGSDTVHNVPKRQEILIDNVIDTCIILHIYEKIKAGSAFEEVSKFFPKDYTENSFNTLKNKTQDEILRELLKLQIDGQKDNKLTSHENITKIAKPQKIKRTNNTTREASQSDIEISALNNAVGETISIYNSGAKDIEKIHNKISRKKGNANNASDIRDITRLTVLPRTPEYAQDFIHLMELMHEPKKIKGRCLFIGESLPRVFAERPEMRSNGYFSQKLYLANDRKKRGELTENNTATISEIKILPSGMLKGDRYTAPINQVEREIADFLKKLEEDKKEYLAYLEKISKSFSAFSFTNKDVTIDEFLQKLNSYNNRYKDFFHDLKSALEEFKANNKTKPELIETLNEYTNDQNIEKNLFPDKEHWKKFSDEIKDLSEKEKINFEERLKKDDNKKKDPFATAEDILNLTYHPENIAGDKYYWPIFPEKGLCNAQSCQEMQKMFFNLATRIHIDEMINEKPEWILEYLKTGLLQQIAHEEKTKKSIREDIRESLPNHEIIPNVWLNRIMLKNPPIENEKVMSLNDIKKAVIAEYGAGSEKSSSKSK